MPTHRDPERSGNPALQQIAIAVFAVRQFAGCRLLHHILGGPSTAQFVAREELQSTMLSREITNRR